MSKKDSGGAFTARDFELLASAMSCTKSPVEIDYKAFATQGGFKNAASAKAAWHGLKKKIEKVGGSASVEPSLTVTDPAETSRKGAKSGKKRKEVEDPDEDDDEEVSKAESSKKGPAKKKGRQAPSGGTKTAKAKAVGGDGDDDEALPDVKVKGEEVEDEQA